MENSTSTDVDRSCNIRKVQFELMCGFAEMYFTDIHSRDKFGISVCLWTQHLTVLPVSWVSEIQLQLFSSHAVISHGFLTNSTFIFILFVCCVIWSIVFFFFFFSDRSLRVSLPLYRCHSVPFRISPTASQSPWRLAVYRRKKVRANWAEVSPWGMERWLARLVKVNKGGEEKKPEEKGEKRPLGSPISHLVSYWSWAQTVYTLDLGHSYPIDLDLLFSERFYMTWPL